MRHILGRIILAGLWLKFTSISLYHDFVFKLTNIIYDRPMFIIKVGAYLPRFTHKFISRRAYKWEDNTINRLVDIFDNLDRLAMRLRFVNEANEEAASYARLDMESDIYESIPWVFATLFWMNLHTGTQLRNYKTTPEILPEFLDDEFVAKAAVMGNLEDCLKKFEELIAEVDGAADQANLLE